MEQQIDLLVTVFIAFLSAMTITGVSVMGILISMLVSAKREVSDLRREVAAYKAVADKLQGDARDNVNQIWNRLDDEVRADMKTLVRYVQGICPEIAKEKKK